MSGWEKVRLSDVCQFKPPKSIARAELSEQDLVSFVPMNDLGELEKHFEAKETRLFGDVVRGYTYFADNDVLCAKITPCFENGKLGIARGLVNGVGFGSSEFVVMRPGDKLAPEFLYYYLARDEFRAAGTRVMTGAVGHKRVPKEYFEDLLIPLPSADEQQRIVAILDQAFAALDRARECAEANLANAGQLFELTLFGRFSEEGSDWANCTVGDLVTLQRGFDITKAQQREGDVPVVSSSGSKSFHDTAKATAPGVVVGRKGSIGSVHYLEEDFWPHDTTLYVKDFKGNDPRLIYYMLRGLKLADLDTGAANPSLNRNLVHPLEVSCPPLEQQKAVADRLFEIERFTNDIASQYASQLADIAALRQSLLQQAFSGQLT